MKMLHKHHYFFPLFLEYSRYKSHSFKSTFIIITVNEIWSKNKHKHMNAIMIIDKTNEQSISILYSMKHILLLSSSNFPSTQVSVFVCIIQVFQNHFHECFCQVPSACQLPLHHQTLMHSPVKWDFREIIFLNHWNFEEIWTSLLKLLMF